MSDARWSLPAALGIGERPELIALVGGGGKTSLMFALADALPGRVVITTTTRIFTTQMKHAPAIVYAEDLSPLSAALDQHKRCFVVGRVASDKALGVERTLPARLLARPDVDWVLVEADGSRMHPVKAPADHEPVVPPETTLLIPVAGIDALEGPLDQAAHRPERIRELLGRADSCPPATGDRQPLIEEDQLTPGGLARLLAHPAGGLKGAPAGARIVPFLNKVETDGRLAAARAAAALMLAEPRVSRVVIGALHDEAPVREVARRVAVAVLAAGESSRMGRNKLHLPWGETTVLGRTLANARAASIHSALLVTGHEPEPVRALAAVAGVPLVHNPDYQRGMLSSVQVAARALPPEIDALLVMLGDQPLVEPPIIDQLLRAYAAGPRGLVAPAYRGARGNPVLIDRRYFAELLQLAPGDAPRTLLQRHPEDVLLVEVGSEAVLIDLDRPEDYEHRRPAIACEPARRCYNRPTRAASSGRRHSMKDTPDIPDWPVRVIRSAQRRKTVSGRLENGELIIRAPAAISDQDLAPIIEGLKQKIAKRDRKAAPSDDDLEKRAQQLNRKYFDGRLRWRSVRYVTNQNSRFGSCTPEDGTIRLSHRLAKMPVWVRDYVLVHELAHLLEANHGPRFWSLVNRYPLTERARGYLMAVGLEAIEGEAE